LVQSVLFFVLGFLCAGFLALLVAPAIWRRAVALTRRRIEGSVPLTQAEIRADKDQLRAEFAMATRRLEMANKALQEKAAVQAVEIGREHEKLKAAVADATHRGEVIVALESRIASLGSEIAQRDQNLKQLTANLTEAEKLLEQRAGELEKLGQMYDDASFLSSNRQIELVARESELEKFAADLLALRNQRKEAEARNLEIAAENKVAHENLKAEQKRVADLDKRIERLLGVVADREEKLERREKELARLREKLKGGSALDGGARPAAPTLQARALQTDAKLDRVLPPSGGEIDRMVAKLNADRVRLEERLVKLANENRKLKGDLATGAPANGHGSDNVQESGGQESARLREQMTNLAAEVVHLTAMLDGPASPIAKALAMDEKRQAAGEDRSRIPSLADRVRALQKTTPPR
jgi:chromosome segregation ATPase